MEESKGKTIVAVLPSCVERYLSLEQLNDSKLTESDEEEI
jgi:hypothetical protein